ncbi:PPOX class F420-dependent oxidoreductase [Spongisporangium articulatum]|uniref:PPOX class F420-dependent oxidoreductase n=1 Tax=Spongisporangium articulatum TaxID=3362603 RepID=A0ABW8AM56_9ACTN
MDLDSALDFTDRHPRGVLTTLRRNGLPQLSTIMYKRGDDGVIRVSITADRAKYFNLQRNPWAALHVSSDDQWQYVVLEADVELTPVAEAPDDATVEELVRYYREAVGEHPDWDDYRAAMVRDKRVIARLKPTRAYGALRIPTE